MVTQSASDCAIITCIVFSCYLQRKMQASISAPTLEPSLSGSMYITGRSGDQIMVYTPCEVCFATSMVHLTCTP